VPVQGTILRHVEQWTQDKSCQTLLEGSWNMFCSRGCNLRYLNRVANWQLIVVIKKFGRKPALFRAVIPQDMRDRLSAKQPWFTVNKVGAWMPTPSQKTHSYVTTEAPMPPCIQHFQNKSFHVHPISFSIPRHLIRGAPTPAQKSRVLASIIPGKHDTYAFSDQESYYEGYTTSFFGATYKKGGWDCLRHYEILACGCIPYMPDAPNLPAGTMFLWPRETLTSILQLKGVDHQGIRAALQLDQRSDKNFSSLLENTEFDLRSYYGLLESLVNHMRRYLTTEAMGRYLLSFSSQKPEHILFVGSADPDAHYPDYQADTLFHGLRSIFGNAVVDVPKRPWMYSNYPDAGRDALYGKGFTYGFHLQDASVNRQAVEDKISSHEFSHIIFAVTHHGRHSFIDRVQQHYARDEVFFVDGSDTGAAETDDIFHTVCGKVGLCFRRELVCADVVRP